MKNALDIWFLPYIHNKISKFFHKTNKPKHVLFCLVDHFEPACVRQDIHVQRSRVETWRKNYPLLAQQYKDSDGYSPQHSFFYPPHEIDEHLEHIVDLCKKGFGEVELHLHHEHYTNPNEGAILLKNEIKNVLQHYSKFGIFGINKSTNKKNFGFIHGDWALDNSRNNKFCGVNNELQVLNECGCYADFTFPSICESQPSKINSLYYAIDNPNKPKSYNRGIDVEVAKKTMADIMMIQGPLGIRLKDKLKFPYISVEAANISKSDIPTSKRIDFWVNTAISVKGREEWIVIKVHTHGAIEKNYESVLGKYAYAMHDYLQNKYNDGKNYFLHYMSARQLYNVIKAAEDGKTGNPNKYRDYLIDKPGYLL